LPDTCTIVANTITCASGFDWSTVWPALIGIGAAILAALLTNSHQRKEASKQRQSVATAAVMRAAYNMVRSSHRDLDKMLDHSSEFAISIRILAADLQSDPGPSFYVELLKWKYHLDADCNALPFLDRSDDHGTAEIKAVGKHNTEFVGFLNSWLHIAFVHEWFPPARWFKRKKLIDNMQAARLRLWPAVEPGPADASLSTAGQGA
jgi:hypothetical protein